LTSFQANYNGKLPKFYLLRQSGGLHSNKQTHDFAPPPRDGFALSVEKNEMQIHDERIYWKLPAFFAKVPEKKLHILSSLLNQQDRIDWADSNRQDCYHWKTLKSSFLSIFFSS